MIRRHPPLPYYTQALTQKRLMNLAYLRRAHAGGREDSQLPPIHWLNTVSLSRERLGAFVEAEVRVDGYAW